MDMNIEITIDELLELWVKYTYRLFNCDERADKEVVERRQINDMLDKKGITSVAIHNMTEETYTLQYSHRSSKIEKEVQIIKE
ncbi:hypothetical protein Amet_1730 [Alkaliphilus metalliredigens QYMF]|uniref:Uncharacterized protein n=1 Tax=Alkaliphilus metalliredigens (strain QYMF) TaxID=293826 RepID=A6TNY8_ALKMQ|nr:hypothetical protein [Alkaliphilus metalliredigens]ABR47906.1 hypothetical protein Amet_1730 [Alkaliphilus metalliredigens QYMF]